MGHTMGAIACLFTEAGQSNALARRPVENTGVRIGERGPLGSGLIPGADLCEGLILGLARAYAGCAAGD